jgi:uncharacterized protein (TIRG00374 family)
MKKPLISKPVKIAVEIALLGLLALLFVRILDVKQFQDIFTQVTFRVFLGILGFQLVLQFLGTAQWMLILREAGISRGPWRVFWSKLSGYSVTYLTPSMYFGGEPVRAALYKDAAMSYQRVYATIALDKYIELFGKMPCILIGFSLLLLRVHTGWPVLVLASILIFASVGFFLFLTVKLFSSRTFIVTLSKKLIRPLARVKRRTAVKVLRAIREFAKDVAEVIHKKKVFYVAMVLSVLYAVVEVFQTYYLLTVLGTPDIYDSFIIFASVVVQGLIGFLPGNLGGMEGTNLFVFSILWLGSTPSLIYSIILRMGQMSMVLLGILNIVVSRVVRAGRKGADRN